MGRKANRGLLNVDLPTIQQFLRYRVWDRAACSYNHLRIHPIRHKRIRLSQPEKLRLGILLSGRGSNFLAIAASIRTGRPQGVEIAVAISNIADAPGLAAARDLNLPTKIHVSKGRPRADHDRDMLATLREHNVDYVILAGYMRLLSPEFIHAFPNRILNIHPSLLPAFPGLDAQTQAFDYGVKIAGCTVHFVDEHLDHGVIILQRAIPVPEMDPHTDGAHTLAALILAEEHQAYPEAIARVASGRYQIHGRRYLRTS